MADSEDIEQTLFITPTVSVYRIPPSTSLGHRSGEWRVADKIFGACLTRSNTCPHNTALCWLSVRPDVPATHGMLLLLRCLAGGRLRMITKGSLMEIRIEDVNT